ncbi:cytochrome c biogenesis protein [Chloroflexota bacterium]
MGHIFRRGLPGLSFILFIATLYLIFLYVPTEKDMGIVQRIFYLHVPLAWVSFLAFFIVFLGSILYLWRRESKWDDMASSSASVGTVFTTLFLITGSIWAKQIWGVWWAWSPRLTTALVLWLIYIAYLLVRSFAVEESQGTRFAAVISIIGFIDVPVVALATTLWRTQHPGSVIFQGGLAPPMLLTLLVSLAAFSTLYVLLLVQAKQTKRDSREIMRLREVLK